MDSTIKVILDLSDEVQELLNQQHVDLPYAIQEDLPQIRLTDISDPESPSGSKDITVAILATATLIRALYPVIVRILNQLKPDTAEVRVEEKIIYSLDGRPEYTRVSISMEKKYNQQVPTDGSAISKKMELPKSLDASIEPSKNNMNGLDEKSEHHR